MSNIITLIGMSGVGKTWWSKKLAELGYYRICCDDMIEERLQDELVKHGYSGINDVAKWMGQPFHDHYPYTSYKYLKFEREVMNEIIKTLAAKKKDAQKIVIDTTGSVIYTGGHVLKKLRTISTVVYFETSDAERKEMFRIFMEDPKPLIWGDRFRLERHEDELTALKRCYPGLLEFREREYRKYAHHSIDLPTLRSEEFSVDSLLSRIS